MQYTFEEDEISHAARLIMEGFPPKKDEKKKDDKSDEKENDDAKDDKKPDKEDNGKESDDKDSGDKSDSGESKDGEPDDGESDGSAQGSEQGGEKGGKPTSEDPDADGDSEKKPGEGDEDTDDKKKPGVDGSGSNDEDDSEDPPVDGSTSSKIDTKPKTDDTPDHVTEELAKLKELHRKHGEYLNGREPLLGEAVAYRHREFQIEKLEQLVRVSSIPSLDEGIDIEDAKWGKGRTIAGQYYVEGNEVYADVMFEHGIEIDVQLLELNKSTLGTYIKKAAVDMSRAATDFGLPIKKRFHPEKNPRKWNDNRYNGLKLAVKKLVDK